MDPFVPGATAVITYDFLGGDVESIGQRDGEVAGVGAVRIGKRGV